MPDSLKKYSDRVLGYLRDAYGINAEVQHGGKHPCVAFNWHGVARRITLRHDGGVHGFDLKRQDIRRVLGAPPATTGETAMVMIETAMPHQVAPVPPPPEVSGETVPAMAQGTAGPYSCRGSIAAHADNGCLQFRFPKDTSPFAVGTELTAERFGEGWLIVPANHKGTQRHSALREQGKRAVVNVMMRAAGIAKPFPSIEAEYVIGDGQILVSPLADLSAYLIGEPPAPPLTDLPAEGWKPEPPSDGLTAAEMRGDPITGSYRWIAPESAATPSDPLGQLVDWSESRIREVLAMVRAIEAAGLYRIERESDGTLAFAPQLQVIR